MAYGVGVPKLWDETIETHRHQVREAILTVTAALVQEGGRRSVTMSQIAEVVGIGRATLYKYFPDIDAILHAWHAEQIHGHFQELVAVRDGAADPGRALEAVLAAFARIAHETRSHGDMELVSFLHQDPHVAHAQRQLHDLVCELIAAGARTGHVRDDVAPDELATYCLHALGAAGALPSDTAVQRLVEVTLTGLLAS